MRDTDVSYMQHSFRWLMIMTPKLQRETRLSICTI